MASEMSVQRGAMVAPRPRQAQELQLARPCRSADLQAAQECEQVGFGRRYGNTPEEVAAKSGAYEPARSFGAVLTTAGRALGAVRLLRNGRAGLKTLSDAARQPWSLAIGGALRDAELKLATTWDVGTFGVDNERLDELPGRAGTLALFSVMFGASRDNHVSSFVAVLDAGARRPNPAAGVQVNDLPGAKPEPYLGSASSVPVLANMPALHRNHARNFRAVRSKISHGRGIPGLASDAAAPDPFSLQAAAAVDQQGTAVRLSVQC